MNDFKENIIIFQWDKTTNNVITPKKQASILLPPKNLPFYYSLTIILLQILIHCIFNPKKKNEQWYTPKYNSYITQIARKGPQLDHEKKNKLQNNLLCLKSLCIYMENSNTVYLKLIHIIWIKYFTKQLLLYFDRLFPKLVTLKITWSLT